jgi:hypothetical protein
MNIKITIADRIQMSTSMMRTPRRVDTCFFFKIILNVKIAITVNTPVDSGLSETSVQTVGLSVPSPNDSRIHPRNCGSDP